MNNNNNKIFITFKFFRVGNKIKIISYINNSFFKTLNKYSKYLDFILLKRKKEKKSKKTFARFEMTIFEQSLYWLMILNYAAQIGKIASNK